MNQSRCAACRSQRRKCPSDCIFFPYFPANDPQRFACVHRIYSCHNVAKMLQQIPPYVRAEAADALYFEAQRRIDDPVYGCVRIISQLHQEILNTEIELVRVQALLAFHKFEIPQVHVHQPSWDILPSQSNTANFLFDSPDQDPGFN